MAQSMAFINQKGGVGKTTLVANAGARWGRQGYRVLLIDLDPQAHLTLHFHRGLDEERRDEHNIYRILRNEITFESSIQSIEAEAIDLVPSHIDLSAAEWELGQEVGREVILRDQLLAFLERQPYDLVLIDCPPSLGLLSLNALAAVDDVVVPVQAEFFALLGMAQLMRVVELVRSRLHPGLNWRVVVPTLVDLRTNLGRDVIDELEGHVPGLVTENWLTKRIKVAEAPSHGESIFTYAGDTPAADEFRRVCDEIAKRVDLGEPSGPPVVLPGDVPEGASAEGSTAEDPADESPTDDSPSGDDPESSRVGHPFPGRFSRFGEEEGATDEVDASAHRSPIEPIEVTAPSDSEARSVEPTPGKDRADESREVEQPEDEERETGESDPTAASRPSVVPSAEVASTNEAAFEEEASNDDHGEPSVDSSEPTPHDPISEVTTEETTEEIPARAEERAAENTEDAPDRRDEAIPEPATEVEGSTVEDSPDESEPEDAPRWTPSSEPVPVGGFHPVPSAPEADLPPRLRTPSSFEEVADTGGRLHPAAHPAASATSPTPPSTEEESSAGVESYSRKIGDESASEPESPRGDRPIPPSSAPDRSTPVGEGDVSS